VYAYDDAAQFLDAEYSVKPDEDLLALILESSSGRHASRGPRNPAYRPALEVLLTGCGTSRPSWKTRSWIPGARESAGSPKRNDASSASP
jgi:hypothetical protein